MEEVKHHYRKIAKSDHLGAADLEDYLEQGRKLIFTISHVKQELGARVAGKVGDFNVAYFTEKGVKPWVVNMTNGKILAGFANSNFVEDWVNMPVELYIDETIKMKGELVGGVRVRAVQPNLNLPELTPDHKRFAKAKEAWKNGKSAAVKAQFTITPEVEKLLSK